MKETCEGDEVAFQCALVLRSPCGEWLESNDVRASTERNPPQSYPLSWLLLSTVSSHQRVSVRLLRTEQAQVTRCIHWMPPTASSVILGTSTARFT